MREVRALQDHGARLRSHGRARHHGGGTRARLCNAHGCRQEPGGKWRALGLDRCGDPLEAIVAIEHEMIVITVF
jgi:hypothetical protein